MKTLHNQVGGMCSSSSILKLSATASLEQSYQMMSFE